MVEKPPNKKNIKCERLFISCVATDAYNSKFPFRFSMENFGFLTKSCINLRVKLCKVRKRVRKEISENFLGYL